MAEYTLTQTPVVIRTADEAHIPDDPANADRQEYDRWLAAGGVPDPADPLPPVYDEETRTPSRQAKTVDATPVTLPPLNLHLQTVYGIDAEVTAIADNGQEMRALYAVACKRLNQAAIKVGTEVTVYRVNDTNTAPWAVSFAASGNALVMTVTGVSGRTIDWLVASRIVSFTPLGRAPDAAD